MMTLAEPAVDALTLLARRIRELPGFELVEDDEVVDPLRIAIDVRRTGFSGYGIVRRLQGCEGVRLEPHGDRVVARFRSARDICDHGTRLLFGLAALV
jgi:hypothetical protein